MDDLSAAVAATPLPELNLRRLLCPLPVIRLEQYVAAHPEVTQLRVVATDPGVKHDIPVWCRMNGHRVIALSEADGEIIQLIQIGSL
ncbi:MAG: sulfurtransferase TusA family protein [Gammaproteobacteria bacterium]|nr:sulfurtransferase TusA family protein [Gammaproteobacteria bacterium]